MLPCPIKKLFHTDCLGCGIQRSFQHLLNSEISESFAIYPPLLIGLLLIFIFASYNIFASRKIALNYLLTALLLIASISYMAKHM
jgi:hypothetical protein